LGFSCTQTAVINSAEEETGTVSSKALTNPAGPDITVNAQRLQASLQVLTNQTITREEIEDGCAQGGTTGRTLIRFDVETPNKGPGTLSVGQPSCKSTDPSASCLNVNCDVSPECCSGGRNVCTTSGGGAAGRGFEYNS